MGAAAACWALEKFDRSVVADQYQELFVELGDRRAQASEDWHKRATPPLSLDPVRCFQPFATSANGKNFLNDPTGINSSLKQALELQRLPLWQLLASHLDSQQQDLLRQALEQKHGMRLFD